MQDSHPQKRTVQPKISRLRNPDLEEAKDLSQMCPGEPKSPAEFVEILEKTLDFLASIECTLNQSYLNHQGRAILVNIWVMASKLTNEPVMVPIWK